RMNAIHPVKTCILTHLAPQKSSSHDEFAFQFVGGLSGRRGKVHASDRGRGQKGSPYQSCLTRAIHAAGRKRKVFPLRRGGVKKLGGRTVIAPPHPFPLSPMGRGESNTGL